MKGSVALWLHTQLQKSWLGLIPSPHYFRFLDPCAFISLSLKGGNNSHNYDKLVEALFSVRYHFKCYLYCFI